MVQLIGPKTVGPTNVMQVTFVFDHNGDIKGASGYERDSAGATSGQWRNQVTQELDGRSLVTEVLRYCSERIHAIANPE